MKIKVTVLGKPVSNPILKSLSLMFLPIWLLVVGLTTAPIVIPLHLFLRWKGLKGIYFVGGHFMDISRNSLRPHE